MRFSTDPEQLPTTVAMIVAIVLLLASLGFVAVPKPDPTTEKNKINAQALKAQQAGKDAEKLADASRAQLAKVTWSGSSAQIGPTVLALVTAIAEKHHVTLVTFRNQKATDDGNLTQYPFLVNVQGGFIDVAGFEKDIETGAAKIAVESFQVASSDEASDTVTATVAVEAYMVDTQPVATTDTNAASKTVKNGKGTTTKTTTTTTIIKTGSDSTTQPAAKGAAKGAADGQKAAAKTKL